MSIIPIGTDDPKLFLEHIMNGPNDNRPRILLLGFSRSGKTTIQQTVFEQVSTHETVFLASTDMICKYDYPGLPLEAAQSSLINLQIIDFPSPDKLPTRSFVPYIEALSQFVCSIIFVIDSSVDEINRDIVENIAAVAVAASRSPHASLDIFIHKLDPELSLPRGERVYSEWESAILEELPRLDTLPLKFYATSMLDPSVLEACSLVVQRLLPWTSRAQQLLDGLVASCSLEKALLLDAFSKLYIATDSSLFDTPTYELCSSFVETAVDTSFIYEAKERSKGNVSLHECMASEYVTGVIRLSNGLVLYLKQVSTTLVLVVTLYSQSLNKKSVIEYNIKQFQKAVEEIAKNFARENESSLE